MGGFLNLDISRRFALLFELSVSAQNSRVQYDQASGNMVLCGIDIPIYALAYWTLHDSGRFYVGGGPFSCAGIYGRAKIGNRSLDLYEKRYADDGGAEISMVENFYSGFGLVVGYEFKNRIRVFLDYKISITDMVGFRNTSVRIYPHRLGFGIGYRFGK